MTGPSRLQALFALFLAAAALLVAQPAAAGHNAWTRLGLDDREVGCLVLGSEAELYASAGYDGSLEGIWKSTDGGETWKSASSGLPWPAVSALAVDQTRPDTLFAVDRVNFQSQLYKSNDGAATWSSLGRGGAHSVLVAGTSPSRVYVGLDHEVMSSADGGKSWKESILNFSPGGFFDDISIISLAAGQSDSSTIYAGADMDYPHESIFESSNAGDSWAQRSDGLPQQQRVNSLAVDPTNPARVLAASTAGLWRSTNGGSSWTLALQTPTRVVVLDPTDPSIVYAGTLGQGVQVSRDGGARWSAFNEGGPNRFVLSLAIEATGRHLYAGTRSGVYGYDFNEESAPLATPVDLAVASTGNTDFLAAAASGRVVLGSVDSAGKTARQQAYGPYRGWTPIAYSGGLDGLTRVLWKNQDGRSDVWLAGPDGVQGSFVFAAEADLDVVDVAGAPDGSTRVLSSGNGGASLGTIDAFGFSVASLSLGSYPGWTATAISEGVDGLTRILWNNDDGRSGVSIASPSAILATVRFAPEDGWTTVDLGVGGDGRTRLLRIGQDEQVAVWVVDDEGTIVARGPAYSGPSGLTVRRLSSGSDGSSRVLFTAGGTGVVWILSSTGEFQDSFELSVPVASSSTAPAPAEIEKKEMP